MGKRADQQAQTRADILAAATLCFELYGYEAATMRGIAKQASLSTGAIFANWPGKDALYREIYGHAPISPEQGRSLMRCIEAALADPSVADHTARQLWNARDLVSPPSEREAVD